MPLEDEFRAFARDPGDVVAGALLIERVIDPASDVGRARAELERLAAEADGVNDGRSLAAYLQGAGFRGAETYYVPENSALGSVLETRRGIPITLAIVVIGVAERLGLAATGINFPQHFLVQVDGVLIDPFRMQVIDDEEQRAWLAGQDLAFEEAFPSATPLDIMLRMLNNLRMLAVQRNDHAGALDLSAYQLLLAPDPLPFHLERVDLWVAAGVPAMARHELEAAIRLAPGDGMKAALAARLAELDERPDRLH
ncbi:MAG: transglutaminase family protein [Gammaproteobacteria bacterium]